MKEYTIMQGDWVRFYQSGKLVIGQVEYITKGITGRYEIKTDIGSVTEDFVFEVRKSNDRQVR
jgi:hypothetical protein